MVVNSWEEMEQLEETQTMTVGFPTRLSFSDLLQKWIENQLPPGSPPRPGLIWKPMTHRWIRPKSRDTESDRVRALTRIKWSGVTSKEVSESLKDFPIHLLARAGRLKEVVVASQKKAPYWVGRRGKSDPNIWGQTSAGRVWIRGNSLKREVSQRALRHELAHEIYHMLPEAYKNKWEQVREELIEQYGNDFVPGGNRDAIETFSDLVSDYSVPEAPFPVI